MKGFLKKMQTAVDEKLFILTWNLLAPIFVRPNKDDPSDFAFFGHCSEEQLAWERRKREIEKKIVEMNPDVLLLQEVEMERNVAGKWDVPKWLIDLGFEGWRVQGFTDAEWEHQFERNLRVLNRGAVTGNATLWKTSRCRFVSSETTPRTLVVSLAVGNSVFAVCNVHLEGIR